MKHAITIKFMPIDVDIEISDKEYTPEVVLHLAKEAVKQIVDTISLESRDAGIIRWEEKFIKEEKDDKKTKSR